MLLPLKRMRAAIFLITRLLFVEASQVAWNTVNESPQVSLPVSNPTKSFWTDTPNANPLAKEGSTGDLTSDADVCIIGSGITGVSTAYHLARKAASSNITLPLTVAILEARDFCSGATGRNGGHLTPYKFENFIAKQLKYGLEETVRGFKLETYVSSAIVGILEDEDLADEVDLVHGGHTSLFLTDDEYRERLLDFTAAQAAGLDVNDTIWYSAEETQRRYGAAYPAAQFGGHNLWPLKLVTQLFYLAKIAAANVQLALHTQTPVTKITPISFKSSRRWELSTPRGSIACSYVVHATNGYAAHLLPQFQGTNGIVPTRGQIIAIRANATLKQLGKTSWDGNVGYEYWFPRPVNSPDEPPLVILGGGRDKSGPGQESGVTDDSIINNNVHDVLIQFLADVFPGLYSSGVLPEMEWTGVMGYTADGEPFVGPVLDTLNEVQYDGQFIAAGFTGHGMPRTFACAEAVATMILSDIKAQPWIQPEWLPNRYLTWNKK